MHAQDGWHTSGIRFRKVFSAARRRVRVGGTGAGIWPLGGHGRYFLRAFEESNPRGSAE